MSSRSGLPRMWFSARAVRVNGKSSPRARLGGRRDPLRGEAGLVEAVVGVVVLDRAADRARARRLGRSRRRPRPVRGRIRSRGRPRSAGRWPRPAPRRARPPVERRAAVLAAERERETRAGRRQRAEAERRQRLRRARVPGVRDHERLTLVQRAERGAPVRLAGPRHLGLLRLACVDPLWPRCINERGSPSVSFCGREADARGGYPWRQQIRGRFRFDVESIVLVLRVEDPGLAS